MVIMFTVSKTQLVLQCNVGVFRHFMTPSSLTLSYRLFEGQDDDER